ncbi:MAG: hypothetical protein JO218_00475, partial [Burkholderiales bacterium]|nr:hypothetical protein [Burkholderiales bacterium]
GPGTLLGNVALTQTQTDNVGNEGGTIPLQSLTAALVDTGGSEVLGLKLAGLPVGAIVSDGSHTATVTADAKGTAQAVDITGWNTSTLSLTPPANYSGTLQLTVTATATAPENGSTASVSQHLTVQVNAIAQAPSLTMTPPTTKLSRQLINTSWEGVCNHWGQATILDTDEFAGWSMLPVARHKDAAFEVWANGDYAQTPQGKWTQVQDAPGDGQEWLGLSSGYNSHYQAPGIAQDIDTIAGATYSFSLDYAGQLGLTGANTQIGVYLDGTLLGSYSNTSATQLNWQTLHYQFQGDGQAHTLSVQLINGTDASVQRGAMLDGLNLVETLPQSASTVYGFAGTPIALPQIADTLSANDPNGQLYTTVTGLPVGVVLSDGTHSATVPSDNATVDVSGWNLAKLTLTVPQDGWNGEGDWDDDGSDGNSCWGADRSTLNAQFVATCVEPGNGSTASIAKNVAVQLLDGQACATPAGVNPYVSYANSQSATYLTGPVSSQTMVASPLVPVSGTRAIVVPATPSAASASQLAVSMEAVLSSLSESVGAALLKELGLGD